jgi:hypothetical protein
LEGREFASDACRRFPGSHQFRPRLEYFRHEPFAPLALEIRPVNGGSGFELGKFGFQRLDAGGMSCSVLDHPNVPSHNFKTDPIKAQNPSHAIGSAG